jgi:GntR family transcriptional repressor for pyruvate dehydrogenase complex
MSPPAPKRVALAALQIRSSSGHTLASQIVNCIREALFNGDLNPDDVVGSETELAERFGVSRLCVRDALRSLAAMGIVEIRMGASGGARIARPDLERLSDAVSVQLALLRVESAEIAQAEGAIESMTAELAAENATAEDLQHLRDLLDQAERSLDDAQVSDRLGREFHLAVAHASHNKFLEAQLRAFRSGVWRSLLGSAMTRPVAEDILATHRELYERIRKRDGEGARKLMKEHVSSTTGKRPNGRSRRGHAGANIACFPAPRARRTHR